MSLTDENGGMNTTMLVSPTGIGNAAPTAYPYPVYQQGGGSGSGMGNGFGDGAWIILLIIVLLAAGGGWGNNSGNGGGSQLGGGQPIIINDGGNGGSYGAVQRGFDQAATMASLNGIQSGISGLSTQLCNCCGDVQMSLANGFSGVQNSLCNGFAGVNATVNSGFANAETAANARQMANMQQAFAGQTAMAQGFNQLGTQFADCCCENRLASADLKYTIATENCADRAAISDGIRDVITNQTANTQRILDQLCQDKIDAKNEKIADLERQLTAANLAASQIDQTARILAGQNSEVDALYNRLRNCPVPTMPVYGMQPIFTCQPQQSCGCGCGCNGGNSGF